MRMLPLLLVVFLLAAGCSDGDETACEQCTVTLEPGTRLLPSDEVSFVVDTKVVAADNGNLFAAPIGNPSAVAMYSPEGSLLGVLGRKGSGPGELGVVQGVYAVGDSIYVVEQNQEVELFDAAGRWLRTLDGPPRAAAFWPLPGGRMVVRLGGSYGALAVVSRAGSAPVELAPRTGTDGEDRPPDRDVAVGSAGPVWTTLSRPMDDFYSVEALDLEGDTTSRWEQSLEQLTGSGGVGSATHVASVNDVAFSAPDTLLVLLHRSAVDWRPAAPKSTGGESMERRLAIEVMKDGFDFFLDVIDAEERRLVARLPLPEAWIGGFVRPREIFTIEERDDLELVVQLWGLRISSAPPRP